MNPQMKIGGVVSLKGELTLSSISSSTHLVSFWVSSQLPRGALRQVEKLLVDKVILNLGNCHVSKANYRALEVDYRLEFIVFNLHFFLIISLKNIVNKHHVSGYSVSYFGGRG